MTNNSENASRSPVLRLAILATVVASIAIVYYLFRNQVNDFVLEYLVSVEQDLKNFRAENWILTFLVAFLIYVVVTGCSIPFATVLTIIFSWFFGFWESLLLISFASTLGATLAFLISRYLFRDAVKHAFGKRYQQFNDSFEKEGPYFLFTLRLIALVPFFLVNILMALTPIKTRSFWWVSQLGMLPGTAVYCFLGSQIDSLQTIAEQGIKLNPWLLVAFAILGIFPLLTRFLAKTFIPHYQSTKRTMERS